MAVGGGLRDDVELVDKLEDIEGTGDE